MRLIIYWLALIVLLPLFYLFWWKKRWRLAFGVAIAAVLVISIFLPGMVIYSTLARKIKREIKNKRQSEKEWEEILEKSATESNSQDQTRNKLEKEIKELRKKIMLWVGIGGGGSEIVEKERKIYQKKIQEWFSKYSKENNPQLLLFSGEELVQELSEKHNFDPWVEYEPAENTIDFSKFRDSESEKVKEKILEIIQKEDIKPAQELWKKTEYRGFPIILLKNIDQMPQNQELEELILALFDPAKFDLWKYQKEIEVGQKKEKIEIIPDLSKFIFLAISSTDKPKFSPKLKDKLKPVEPFLDKYFWLIFFLSTGTEIIIFYWLIRSRKKSKSKALKKLGY